MVGDRSDFGRSAVVGVGRAGLGDTQTADGLGFSHSTISWVYREWSRKKRMSSERWFSGPKFLAGARDQVEWARLATEDRKTRGTPITTRYDLLITGCLKKI